MSKKDKNTSNSIGSSLKDSLESLQASLDQWAAVETEVSSDDFKSEDQKSDTHSNDPELMNRLTQQIKNLSL